MSYLLIKHIEQIKPDILDRIKGLKDFDQELNSVNIFLGQTAANQAKVILCDFLFIVSDGSKTTSLAIIFSNLKVI
ncbi:hypothetical protein LCGC14_3094830 [marine sediment metagenome]|uniref:Uncharacterized protein n=1 Tax=marine sediment metagenome TaxID=412755 RepID=A0A0F8WA07_9ZZZZ